MKCCWPSLGTGTKRVLDDCSSRCFTSPATQPILYWAPLDAILSVTGQHAVQCRMEVWNKPPSHCASTNRKCLSLLQSFMQLSATRTMTSMFHWIRGFEPWQKRGRVCFPFFKVSSIDSEGVITYIEDTRHTRLPGLTVVNVAAGCRIAEALPAAAFCKYDF